MNKQNHLKQSIERKRQEMISLAYLRGFIDEKTVRCSQELDDLLNQYSNRSYEKVA